MVKKKNLVLALFISLLIHFCLFVFVFLKDRFPDKPKKQIVYTATISPGTGFASDAKIQDKIKSKIKKVDVKKNIPKPEPKKPEVKVKKEIKKKEVKKKIEEKKPELSLKKKATPKPTPKKTKATPKPTPKAKPKPKVTPKPKATPKKIEETKSKPKEAPKKPVKKKETYTDNLNKQYQDAIDKYTGDLSSSTTAKGSGGGTYKPPEWFYYKDRIERIVKSSWNWHLDDGSLQATVSFNISKTGEVSNIRLVKGSGNIRFDESLVRAVNKASPLPAPEQRFYNDFKFVEFVFKP